MCTSTGKSLGHCSVNNNGATCTKNENLWNDRKANKHMKGPKGKQTYERTERQRNGSSSLGQTTSNPNQ